MGPGSRADAARVRRCCGHATFASEPACPRAPWPFHDAAPRAAAGPVQPRETEFPRLSAAHWPTGAYRRDQLPERVLQFGTGMLLRALCAASVDAANSAGVFSGRIAVIQSTPQGHARAINMQDGLFTLVERGLEHGAPVERTRLVGAISRALVADAEWPAVRDVVARPELQVIVSNVTEAGFRSDASFPHRLTDLLQTRFMRLPEGPPVFVIPTELVDDNGPRLAAMVDRVAGGLAQGPAFREWLGQRVRFCSSLVDRITTGTPARDVRAALERRLGYADALLTVTEPHSLWAIEADPAALRAAFGIAVVPESVIIAPDIGFYRERKLRLLNGAHTATAPLALLAGVRTVREAAEHPRLGAFLRHILFEEIAPATDLPGDAGLAFAASVIDRFRNPWLDHEWRVIAANQTAKLRARVVPSLTGFARKRGAAGIAPQGLALGLAAYLCWGRSHPGGDADLPLIEQHWRATTALPEFAARALADRELWGVNLAELPGLLEATTRWLVLLERDGVAAALEALPGTPEHATTSGT
ncbi:MAG: altronate oxidoreductase [Gemmatimonadetes bacterium]|nr:MAG: altronate oxidoreductase [Gemmatimonadota bacterium]